MLRLAVLDYPTFPPPLSRQRGFRGAAHLSAFPGVSQGAAPAMTDRMPKFLALALRGHRWSDREGWRNMESPAWIFQQSHPSMCL